MKKIEHTNEIDYIFRGYWDIKLLYMDITKHDNGETYLKVINRKGLTNVYMLESGDNLEKIKARIEHVYANVHKSNVNFNIDLFEERMRISQELTKNNNKVKRSVPTGLYREDSFYKGIFVGVSTSSEYKKEYKYISVLPNGKKINGYYDFEKYELLRDITKKYDDSNTYFLINEEEVTKNYKEAIKALKNGDKVEISHEISWEIQEFENFYYHNSELMHKDDYKLTYDNMIVDNDNVVYCEDIEDYMHCDHVFYLENEDIYYSEDSELTYSELEATYIHEDNVDYVIDDQGHEQPVHRDNLDNYFFDADEGVYYTDEHFNDNIIQDYGKTELPPISSGEKDYYIGIELEMEKEDSTFRKRGEVIENVLQESGDNFSNLLEWKKDGSLEHGVEMVTAPISLEIFKKDIVPVIKKLLENGFTSEKGGRCGQHIHISKNVFSDEEQSRLVLIYAKFEKQIKILSRRGTNNSYCRDVLENFDSLEVENSMSIASSQKNKSKFTAINFSNKNTIEFRVFRGTMNTNKLIANIQLVQLLADWSRKTLTIHDILNLNTADFKNEILLNDYQELLQYCVEKEVI